MLQRGKINVVIDGQWGSVGKGKAAGYLALRDRPAAAVCNFMTNAGHWFRSKTHGDFLVQQIPTAAVNPGTILYVCAGAAITLKTLYEEISRFDAVGIAVRHRLMIDSNAVIIQEHHSTSEKHELGRISSTQKGCGAALADKVARRAGVVRAGDIAADLMANIPGVTIGCVATELHRHLANGDAVLGETAQGFDLSLNHGTSYPHVTSRDVTPAALLSDCGVPAHKIGNVYGVVRLYPIRVGHQLNEAGEKVGDSGPYYDDQVELTWEQLSRKIGREVSERTTVTGKVRRVFTFSRRQFGRFNAYCAPTHTILNFCNYAVDVPDGCTDKNVLFGSGLVNTVSEWIREISGQAPVMYGTGADNEAMIDLEREN